MLNGERLAGQDGVLQWSLVLWSDVFCSPRKEVHGFLETVLNDVGQVQEQGMALENSHNFCVS